MTNLVSDELKVCFFCIAYGFALGLIYDLFKLQRRLFKEGIAVIMIQDTLFWIIGGFLFYFTIFRSNYGIIRWYECVIFFIGFYMYITVCSSVVTGIMYKVIHTFMKYTVVPAIKFLKCIFGGLKRCFVTLFRSNKSIR